MENLTAVEFLLAGLLLFATALVERNFFRRCLYILGGLAMVFVCGEEINWGQNVLGFATPDFLMDLDGNGQFAAHSIPTVDEHMEEFRWNMTLLLCMVTGAAFCLRKDRIFGVPLPSIPLMLGFLAVLSLHKSG